MVIQEYTAQRNNNSVLPLDVKMVGPVFKMKVVLGAFVGRDTWDYIVTILISVYLNPLYARIMEYACGDQDKTSHTSAFVALNFEVTIVKTLQY